MRIEKVEKRNFDFYIIRRLVNGTYIKTKVIRLPKHPNIEVKIIKIGINKKG